MATTRLILSLCIALTGVLTGGCGDDDTGSTPDGGPPTGDAGTDSSTPPPGDELRSLKARVADPGVSSDRLRELTRANADLAFDLLRAADEDGNLFFSPHSISVALAMTYGGARTTTEAEMAETLHFALPQAELHPAFNALDQALASRGSAPASEGDDGDAFALRVVNAIWGQRDYSFLESYLDLLAENYGAGLNILDFRTDTEGSRTRINQWVSDQTAMRIPNLIPQGVITEDTALVLTNAIYFKASWLEPFRTDDTAAGDFTLAGGTAVSVPMMNGAFETEYAEGDGYSAMRLGYVGDEVSMLAILPDSDLGALESGVNAAVLDTIVGGLQRSRVTTRLPKFSFRTQLPLKRTLSEMGMPTAFTNAADFSGMDGTRALAIQDVIHEAFIAVDEEGTEAAAATAVVIGVTSVPPDVSFIADRPFLFVIRDDATGAVLFVGRVTDPR